FSAPEVDWLQLAPVLVVLGAGVVGVLIEAFVPRPARRRLQVGLAMGAVVAALFGVALLLPDALEGGGADVLGGSMLLDAPALFLQGTVALLALLALLVIADRNGGEEAFAASS